MRTLLRLAVAAGLTVLAAVCIGAPSANAQGAKSQEAKSQGAKTRAPNARMARLYFMWPSIPTPWAMPIKVDGKQVAQIRANTYFFVDRPPGRHKITIQFLIGSYDAEINVGPGTHYYEIGHNGSFDYPIGFGAINRAANGVTGQQIKGASSSPGLMFLEVERDRGPAALAKLRPAGNS